MQLLPVGRRAVETVVVPDAKWFDIYIIYLKTQQLLLVLRFCVFSWR